MYKKKRPRVPVRVARVRTSTRVAHSRDDRRAPSAIAAVAGRFFARSRGIFSIARARRRAVAGRVRRVREGYEERSLMSGAKKKGRGSCVRGVVVYIGRSVCTEVVWCGVYVYSDTRVGIFSDVWIVVDA